MHSPPLQLHPVMLPVSTTHYFVSGDVTIHEGAAIAPGVLLQADPNSKIVIGSGVCIGLGSVVHAHDGTLEIGEGSIIGAGVLLIGHLKIGDRACIGCATTIFNQSVKQGALVPPGSLISLEPSCEPAIEPEISELSDPWESTEKEPASPPVEPVPEKELPQESDEIDSPASQESVSLTNGKAPAYGQTYVNQLLGRLFPHQQQSNHSNNSHNESSSGSG